MKKFVNDPKTFVGEMLMGIALANPGTLKLVPELNLIMRSDAPRDDKVSIIQGSGSGHEPAHVMLVGKGLLDAACPGDVFAAPPTDAVFSTTQMLNSAMGVLYLVNNYTGDRMGFEMAQEMAEAEGIQVATVIVDDDVAVKDSTYTVGPEGCRGELLRDQSRWGGRRSRGQVGRARLAGPARQLGHSYDGDGPHLVHAPGQRFAPVRAGR